MEKRNMVFGFWSWLLNFQKNNPNLFLIIVSLIIYQIFGKNLRNGFRVFLGLDVEEKSMLVSEKEFEVSKSDLKNTTITKNDALRRSKVIFTAVEEWGTDEESIYRALSGINYYDYLLISDAFGLVKYDSSMGVIPHKNSLTALIVSKSDMTTILENELNKEEREKLCEINPELSRIFL